jgi:hypothetical protein
MVIKGCLNNTRVHVAVFDLVILMQGYDLWLVYQFLLSSVH